jgi:hypothetical protein
MWLANGCGESNEPKQLIAQLGCAGPRPSMKSMSKRTRYADNSKRQQPVQQQRAQAAQQVASQKKAASSRDSQQPSDARSASQADR